MPMGMWHLLCARNFRCPLNQGHNVTGVHLLTVTQTHINTRKYFLRDLVRDKVVKLLHCPGTEMVADALTKHVPGPTLAKHRQPEWMMGTHVPFSCNTALLAHLQTFLSPKHIRQPLGTRIPFAACLAALDRAQALDASAAAPKSGRSVSFAPSVKASHSLLPSRGRDGYPHD